MELSTWQWLRTRVYLVAIGVLRHMTVGARIALVDGEKVLLVRHTYLPGWHFPGGGVEPGETAEAAAARELQEETGYRATGPLRLVGLYLSITSTTNRDHIALYQCSSFEPGPAFVANHEMAEVGWFAHDALPETTTAGTARRVAEIFGNRPPEALW